MVIFSDTTYVSESFLYTFNYSFFLPNFLFISYLLFLKTVLLILGILGHHVLDVMAIRIMLIWQK